MYLVRPCKMYKTKGEARRPSGPPRSVRRRRSASPPAATLRVGRCVVVCRALRRGPACAARLPLPPAAQTAVRGRRGRRGGLARLMRGPPPAGREAAPRPAPRPALSRLYPERPRTAAPTPEACAPPLSRASPSAPGSRSADRTRSGLGSASARRRSAGRPRAHDKSTQQRRNSILLV